MRDNAEKTMPVSTVPGASNKELVSAAEFVGETCSFSGSTLWLSNCIWGVRASCPRRTFTQLR